MLESETKMDAIDLKKLFETPALSCPTCGVKWSGQINCRRCGADLSLLLKTASLAWELRNRARLYLLAGEFEKSIHYARKAQTFHRTMYGKLIERLAMYGIMK